MAKGAVSRGNIGYTGRVSYDVPLEFSYDLLASMKSFYFSFLTETYDEEETFWKVNYGRFFEGAQLVEQVSSILRIQVVNYSSFVTPYR